MEDQLGDLSSAFSVSAVSGENSSYAQHPRWADFKNEGKVAERQRSRRQEVIDRQKAARDKHLNRFRALNDEDFEFEDADADEEDQTSTPSSQKRRPKKARNNYADVLMLSEWLVDIPGELSTEWSMVVCPVGRRCLVIASKGETKVYAKNGRVLATLQSELPGGHRKSNHSTTMLDCIQSQEKDKKKRYLAIDMLSWNGHQFTESEFTLRRFFLKSKMEELEMENKGKPSLFSLLPSCLCDRQAMTDLMASQMDFEPDGLLFYYNDALYTPGQTPLVGWLKPWMLPEILSVELPACYIQNAEPANSFIEKFNKKHKFKSGIDGNKMEVEE